MGWKILDSNLGKGKWFFSLPHNVQLISATQSACYSMGTGSSFLQVKLSGMELTTHVYLVPRLRMNGAIFPLPYTPA
jgi:hypothetical protein